MFRQIAVFFVISLLFCSCYDRIELNDRAFVNSISIDKANEDGNRFSVGVAISDLSSFEGGNKGGEGESKNKSVKTNVGESVSAALRSSEDNSSQKLFFGQTRAVFFGKELLSNKILFLEALDALERDKELSRKMIVIAAEEKGEDICGVTPDGEPSIGVFTEKFYSQHKFGNTFKLNLEGLIIRLKKDNNALMPRMNVDQEDITIGGLAVIKDFAFCGFLNDEETRGHFWQHGQNKGVRVDVDYDGISIPYNVTSHKKKLSFDKTDEGLCMNVEIDVTGDIAEYIFGESMQNENVLQKIQNLVEQKIENEVKKSNYTLQKDYKVDAAGINDMLKKLDYTLWQEYNKKWNDIFESMEVSINVTAKINSVGSKW